MTAVAGMCHMALVRVQGAMRSYGAGFTEDGRFAIFKNKGGYEAVAWKQFYLESGKAYEIQITAKGNFIEAQADGVTVTFLDEERPYLYGGVGLSVRKGSHVSCKSIRVL